MMRNRVKERLRGGGAALGVWMSILNHQVVRIVANSGVDWILFDTEHGPPTFETVDSLVRASVGCKALPLVRVVWNDMNAIKLALDTGAYGVIVPWVNTKEEAERAVSYCRYPPEGVRGCAPGRPASVWGLSDEEYLEVVNDEVLVAVQIETRKAVENIEEIVGVEGVDATFIGPMDLSMSMGYRGKPFHPDVVKAMERVLEACIASGVAPGIAFARGVEHINELIERGFRFVGIGSDSGLLAMGCSETLKRIRR
ncbi:MAG: aldolase/citrate lyase family protein [Candidatus Bathyarchaeia archaeon]